MTFCRIAHEKLVELAWMSLNAPPSKCICGQALPKDSTVYYIECISLISYGLFIIVPYLRFLVC
ncbi:uncharacterized protein ASPGLDRAFT_49959 [Aspergillus glaucus CBS 516.65]|uniref:Uncharacterized protein n=1 Tax=Aspergillus glaucus CBS 516.65 TaxID=1160497 RepID=A0A1L9VDJ9_ASPGL|nr:hypothetical protein ASPGLDRAFT_49959 [Aspergillus glaucus CBS 516.65]OJJ81965.1 hypothetical protein ASPGLDRAFT_49959 [Aspergillus glaucus CBS 516.65]